MNVKALFIGIYSIVLELQLLNSMTDEEWLLLSEMDNENIAHEIEVNISTTSQLLKKDESCFQFDSNFC